MIEAEDLGRAVRATWIDWAQEQPDVFQHSHWLTPWGALDERDRDVDRRIGLAIASLYEDELATLRAEIDKLRRGFASIYNHTEMFMQDGDPSITAWRGLSDIRLMAEVHGGLRRD